MAIKSLPDYKKRDWLKEFLDQETEHTVDVRGLPLANMVLELIGEHQPEWIAVSARDKRFFNAMLAAVVRYDGHFPIRVERRAGSTVMLVRDVPILPFVCLPNEKAETNAYFYTSGGLMTLIKVGAENDA